MQVRHLRSRRVVRVDSDWRNVIVEGQRLLGIRIRPPVRQRKNKNLEYREAINTKNSSRCINIHRVFQACYLAGTCAWLQPVFQEPGASRLIAVVTSIRSTTRFETPSSDCTRSPDEISTIGFSTKNKAGTKFRRSWAAAAAAA
ncbi:putative anion transporter [Dorcoceras hygrometricum]|uniref:Putative anion transporter n=1 Tax=Dorcoceras hygrometricum TaxID=472368 RepID=A0A2Z7A9R3_9LAMI|nr:putative anion transporter [Dorcoceras hygrometricum]